MFGSLLLACAILSPHANRIHSVCDISTDFTFYMDGRFFSQYISPDGADERNWGTLWKLDLTDTNLLVLSSGDSPVQYANKSISHVKRFVSSGGALLIAASNAGFRADQPFHIQQVAKAFGGEFVPESAQLPLKAEPSLNATKIDFYGGGTLKLGKGWSTLISDAAGKPVLAQKAVGKGKVILAIRGLFGHNPDASDPINAQWVKPLLQNAVSGKPVDPSRPPKSQWAELEKQVGSLTLEYHEGTKVYADSISKEYFEIKPILTEITGVDPSKGMITRMLMLPTGGGGFSSGDRIAIGAWWGGFPKNRYPMVELISHEAGHSWVLPYPEPVWNEPIATYLGIRVGQRMKMKEADETLQRAIDDAKKQDPEFKTVDINAPGAPNAVVWGKTFWIFEQLRAKYGEDCLATYFKTKRAVLKPGRDKYSLDDCVAVWSRALGDDLFPWFNSLGIKVAKSKTDISIN